MRFGVSYGNHGNGVHVEDVVVHVRNALRAGGHEAYILPHLLRDAVNVLLEYFALNQASHIAQIKQRTRARFVVVVSEFTDGRTFNSHISSGHGHYVDAGSWQARFDAFMAVADQSDAIWTLSEHQVPQYRALFPDKPVLPFPIGFDPFFPPVRHPPSEAKDIDLIFSGNPTPHRHEVIARLRRKHNVMSCPVSTLNIARSDMIARAKASLHINLAPEQAYTSVMRHHFLLMNGSPVLGERAAFAGELDEFVTQFAADEFAAGVTDYLANGRWKVAGMEAYERYRDARPLAPAIRNLLAETNLA